MNSNQNIEELVRRIILEELSQLGNEEDNQGDEGEGSDTESKGATTWEKIKYATSKLGRYKVNGKFFGKKKEMAAAEERIKALLNKEGNAVIKRLDATIKETNPEFPNNIKGADFLSTAMGIAACYDSIIDDVKKGDLPADAANEIINDLREYVKKILDADLKATYSTVDEGQEDEITEEEYQAIDEAFGLTEDAASDLRDKFKADRAARAGQGDNADFKSTKIDTLKSTKLPLTMLGIGSALGGFSWLVNTEWFRKLFEHTTSTTWLKDIKQASPKITDIKPGEGVYKLLSRVTGIPLDANSDPNQLVKALDIVGGGDADKGVDMLCAKNGVMMKPEQASKGLHEFLKNPKQYTNLNGLFHGAASGTGKIVPTDTTLYGTIGGTKLVSLVTNLVQKAFIKTTTTTGAGYAVAKGFGAVLAPIGIGLVAAGATVFAMRRKGLKQSRAATLNALYQSLRNVPGSQIIEPEGEVDNKIEVPSTTSSSSVTPRIVGDKKQKGDKVGSSKGSDDDLYNTLKNTFKLIVNGRDMLGVRSSDNVGTGAASSKQAEKEPKNRQEPENIETGSETGEETPAKNKKEVFWKNNKGEVSKGTYVGRDKSRRGRVVVKREDGKKVSVSLENIKKMRDKNKPTSPIAEARYIKDERIVKYLEKNLSYDKIKSFEDLLKAIENLRNKIRGAKQSKDGDFNRLISKFNENPIMATDFKTMFDVSADKENMVALKAFIDDLFISLYSGKFGRNNLIDKMSSTGGGNINAIKEKYYGADDPNKAFVKDAQSRDRFKDNLIKFLQDAIRLFQHMYQKRR